MSDKEIKPVVFNGIAFYPEAFTGWTEQEFLAHEAHHGLTEAQLKQAWALLVPQVPKAEEKPKAYVPAKSFAELQTEKNKPAVANKPVVEVK